MIYFFISRINDKCMRIVTCFDICELVGKLEKIESLTPNSLTRMDMELYAEECDPRK